VVKNPAYTFTSTEQNLSPYKVPTTGRVSCLDRSPGLNIVHAEKLCGRFTITPSKDPNMRTRFHLWSQETPVADKSKTTSDTEATGPLDATKVGTTTAGDADKDDDVVIDSQVQHGVKSAQAVTQVWTKRHLMVAYVL
jgi:hypothetical protein